tara:strand:- start:52895 stop:53701 length:807 start_codon:yes stop_codon:yes gene_type:complete
MKQEVTHNNFRKIGLVNWLGLKTLILREIRRFLKVWQQTVFGPLMTALLFLFVFSVAIGKARPEIEGMPFSHFLAPGIIMMMILQNAFANTSSSIVSGKIQGNIVDLLMPPLNTVEITTGYVVGGVARGSIIAIIGFVIISFFLRIDIHSFSVMIYYAIMGSLFMSLIGILGGLWADKFDHMGAVTNFIITPMTFLSGTFYSIRDLPENVYLVAQFNPFFQAIDGFRYGITGYADGNLLFGGTTILILNILLYCFCCHLINIGYKLKS